MDERESKTNPNWKTPSAITSRPELEYWEIGYISDFHTLSSSRQSGMGVGPIPVGEILKFCEHFDIDNSEEFLYIIQSMDNAFLEKQAEKQKSEAPTEKGKKRVKGVKS